MTSEARAVGEHARVKINVDRVNDAAVIAVSGDVDLHAAPDLRGELGRLANDETASLIVVDLSEATFLDSMALGALLAAQKSIESHAKRFVIVVSTPEIRRIFEITMLERVFRLYPRRAEALQALDDGLGA
jgi:anti-anti-sigma factor